MGFFSCGVLEFLGGVISRGYGIDCGRSCFRILFRAVTEAVRVYCDLRIWLGENFLGSVGCA